MKTNIIVFAIIAFIVGYLFANKQRKQKSFSYMTDRENVINPKTGLPMKDYPELDFIPIPRPDTNPNSFTLKSNKTPFIYEN